MLSAAEMLLALLDVKPQLSTGRRPGHDNLRQADDSRPGFPQGFAGCGGFYPSFSPPAESRIRRLRDAFARRFRGYFGRQHRWRQ